MNKENEKKRFTVSEELLKDVQKFIDENLVESRDEERNFSSRRRFSLPRFFNRPNAMGRSNSFGSARAEFQAEFNVPDRQCLQSEFECEAPFIEEKAAGDIDAFISSAEETPNFQNTLQKLIADRNLENAAVYKKAFIDKKFFSKIISNRDYVPKKQTVMALGLALELPLDEYERFLASAGYAFMPSSKFDLIIKYCVMHGIFALFEIDAILDTHNLACFIPS